MIDYLDFYSTPGVMTDPGSHAALLDSLPGDLQSLCRIVQGVMIHTFWAGRYGVQLPADRQAELQLRPVSRKLERILELDPRPLVEARQPEQRLVGNCRDFSVLLTTFLRHRGVAARARCGFGRYFQPGHYEDHWVVEYWNAGEQRWILVDSQLDELQCRQLSIPFDPLDEPRDQFIVGGKAWQLCRTGQADPDTFGIFDLKGLWFVRGDLVRDIASLNKLELLPWDSWGIMEARDEDLSTTDLALLDRAAKLTGDDVPEFETMRQLYENDPRLRVPPAIRSYTQAGVREIDLATI